MDPHHAQSLLSLAWVLITLGRQDEAWELLARLDNLELREDTARGREELRARLDELYFQIIKCTDCGRSWKVPKDQPPVPGIRLAAAPPDDLPAGSCPDCGNTYCIGCAKNNLDSSGRFVCPGCQKTLKLVNEGLKKIVRDWAKNAGSKKRGRGRPRKK
jgi:transposase-like protein